ncbi:hypothetical protein ABPG72_011650 [Tetrahymena utriculariae]
MNLFEDYYTLSLTLMGLLFTYICFQSIIEHKKIHILHETGFGIIVGFVLGLIMKAFGHSISFSGQNFFQIMLPPIIFSAGYNLKKRKFFSNIFYISLYAILGTLINFIITLLLTDGFLKAGLIVDLNNEAVNLSTQDILYFSATMCASDAIAALTLINSAAYPKLFSVVFGEGLLNDAVAIILFNSVGTIVNKQGDVDFEASTLSNLCLFFLKNCFLSVFIGLALGLLATYFTKVFRPLVKDPIKINVFILIVGYSSYCIGEIAEVSSVIAMLTSGIVMNHYMKYNFEEDGLKSTVVTVGTLSSVAESVLFIYLGISSWTYISDKSTVSFSFIGLSFIITIVARLGCIYFTSAIACLFMGKKWDLNKYELFIIWFAGLIRGAVAFALIITIQSTLNPVITSTILFIVFFTTVFLGGFMSSFIKYFTGLMSKSPAVQERNKYNQQLEKQKKEQSKKKISKLKNLEEGFLKPLFIYDYVNRKKSIQEEKKKKLLKEMETFEFEQRQSYESSKSNVSSRNQSESELNQTQKNILNCLIYNQSQDYIINYNKEIVHSSELKNEESGQQKTSEGVEKQDQL